MKNVSDSCCDGKSYARHRGSLAALLVALGTLVAAPAAQAQEKLSTWSGYIVKSPNLDLPTPPITFTAVSASWTQPTVFCTTPDARVSVWVGLDGNGTPTVEQVGTVAVCGEAGAPLYYKAFWEMYAGADSSGEEPFVVYPGDAIVASVTYSGGSYVLTLKDVTTGHGFSTPQSCSTTVVCKRGTAEWVVERPGGGKYPLADYGTVDFSGTRFMNSSGDLVPSTMEMVYSKTILSTCSPKFQLFTDHGGSGSGIHVVNGLDCQWMAAE
jgi:hypothetical protein